MRGSKKLSPFEQMLRAIESELYDLTLELQGEHEGLNMDYVQGYRAALNVMLEKAYAIYNRRFPGEFIALDERTEEASKKILAMLKRGG